MATGRVKWFNNAKGFGFIQEDGCEDDIFTHFSTIKMDGYKTLKAGCISTAVRYYVSILMSIQ